MLRLFPMGQRVMLRTGVVELEVVFLEVGMAKVALLCVSIGIRYLQHVVERSRTSASTSTTTS